MPLFTGVVYKLTSILKPELCYVGSSVDLKKRLTVHKSYYENNKGSCSSKLILEHGEYNIEILEEVSANCENKKKFLPVLKAHENPYITPSCVNKNRAFRTEAEKKEQMKKYQQTYNPANREAILKRMKAYNLANKERKKAYEQANKERRNKQRRERKAKRRAEAEQQQQPEPQTE
jgi:hypothetical protein